ncbi:STAS domain-containing protein [Thalassotalea agarivorans]|uniref:Phospholipid transport system transporter-binding protein n=1 Tax=Thalassotalea agarivorans TaxID=349064 RepID=A0A1I0FRN2_THASX|nr:STAS domain-containing protein [Thalassotalea agarivorans]SET61069.1 phospholipid transport system transporter-binding protein [Thalassotalea agarivorans]
MQVNIDKHLALLSGELTRETVPHIKQGDFDKLLAQDNATIDFANVSRTDTAGLAWIFLQMSVANRLGGKLVLTHLSNDVLKLAKLSGVEALLHSK